MTSILLIDDQPQELATLGNALAPDDYRLVVSTELGEARALFESRGEDFAAVLLDWNLLGSDPLKRLDPFLDRESDSCVEVILKSDDFDHDQIERAIDRGAYFFLVRPFEELQVRAILRAAVRGVQLKRSLAQKVEEVEDAFFLLNRGEFRFRTLRQAEILAVHLGSASADPQIGIGVLELLVNAIEHGNLAIPFEEKTRLLELGSGMFRAEVDRRLSSPEYADRRARVEIERSEGWLDLTISDAGSGFDFRRFLQPDPARILAPNGRGVLLANTMLDLKYRAPGNVVEARIPIAPRPAPRR